MRLAAPDQPCGARSFAYVCSAVPGLQYTAGMGMGNMNFGAPGGAGAAEGDDDGKDLQTHTLASHTFTAALLNKQPCCSPHGPYCIAQAFPVCCRRCGSSRASWLSGLRVLCVCVTADVPDLVDNFEETANKA